MRKIKDLLKFRQVRETIEKSTNGHSPKPKPAKWFWSMFRVDEPDAKKLKELYASGRRLEELMKQPGWEDILSAKTFYMADSDAKTKSLSVDNNTRLAAAASWSALDGFFRELNLRIKAGNSAYEKLKSLKEL